MRFSPVKLKCGYFALPHASSAPSRFSRHTGPCHLESFELHCESFTSLRRGRLWNICFLNFRRPPFAVVHGKLPVFGHSIRGFPPCSFFENCRYERFVVSSRTPSTDLEAAERCRSDLKPMESFLNIKKNAHTIQPSPQKPQRAKFMSTHLLTSPL